MHSVASIQQGCTRELSLVWLFLAAECFFCEVWRLFPSFCRNPHVWNVVIYASAHWKDSLTRERGNKRKAAYKTCMCVCVCVAMMVMGCHVLPWRETETHSSFAVEADLPRWGAHDDRHPLPHTERKSEERGRWDMERNQVRKITLQGVTAATANYQVLFEVAYVC